jgi:hypothetical protein
MSFWNDWAVKGTFNNNFVADEERTAAIEGFRQRLRARSDDFCFLRIEGLAGVGKTRLALEVFRDSPLSDLVLYASNPDLIPQALWTYVRSNNVELVLVVDECKYERHLWLREQASPCEGRVRLLTIGQRYQPEDCGTDTPGLLNLGRLKDEAMKILVKTSYAGLPDEWVGFVTAAATGFVKIAVALAESLMRAKEPLTVSRLIRSREIRPLLEAMLPDPADRQAMEAVALLRRVGWTDDLAIEGQTVCELLELGWRDTQRRIQRIEDQMGLVSRQGRYVYATPHLLAIWLASETWRRLGHSVMWAFHDNLPNPLARNSFKERIADLGSDESTRPLSDFLLGPNGLFPNLQTLENRGSSRFLRLLAVANPLAGLGAIKRLLLGSSREDMSALLEGRTDLIWTLQALAWRADLFRDASHLLLELAVTESRQRQRIGPWATEEWCGLFRIYLGGTSVPMQERLDLLDEAIEDPNERKRLLALQALRTVFAFDETRIGTLDDLGGAPLPTEWHPQDGDEIVTIRRRSLGILAHALNSDLPTAHAQALETLFDVGRSCTRSALVDDFLSLLCRQRLDGAATRRKARECLGGILEFEQDILSEFQVRQIEQLDEELAGSSFSDRLHRYFGLRTPRDRVDYRLGYEEEQRVKRAQAEVLIEEALHQPDLLETEWDWLFSPDASGVYFIAWTLGNRDESLEWWDYITEEGARKGRSLVFASAYLRGAVEAGRLNREDVLDGWMHEGSAMALAILDVILRGPISDTDAERLCDLVENGWLDGSWLGGLRFGNAFVSLSLPLVKRMLEGAVARGESEAADAVTSLLQLRLHEKPEEHPVLAPLAWAVLERPEGLRSRGKDTMAAYYAEELAKYMAEEDPVRAAQTVLSLFESEDAPISGNYSVFGVLRRATELDPEGVWQLVGARVNPHSPDDQAARRQSFRLRLALGKWFSNLIPVGVLLEWAERHRPNGAITIANMASVYGDPLNDLARGLLMTFGDDERIGWALRGCFVSGSFSGPESAWFRGKLETASGWTNDPAPQVSQWAISVVGELQDRIRQTELLEQERGF